jgi:hypothetical protein
MINSYWVVGAMWGGQDDVLDDFLERGYWYCWDVHKEREDVSEKVKQMQDKFLMIKKGDRIAVKKLLGQGSTEIEIRAIGIVKVVDEQEWRVYVDWLPIGLECSKKVNRRVAFRGAGSAIHGPYTNYDTQYGDWIRQIFCV